MILDDLQAIEYIKANKKPSYEIEKARDVHRELLALVEGDNFTEELINEIEQIESENKKIARKKYSRNIKDVFERLLLPVHNVFNATGGSKRYDITSDNLKQRYLKLITSIQNGKSIEKYIEETLINLFLIDPNGVVMLEYSGEDWIKPSYKSINSIRAYEYEGQSIKVLLFEPVQVDEGELYRIVDGLNDRTFLVKGENYTLIEDSSFQHPFNEVPGLIISNIEKVNEEIKLSPLDRVKEIAKEYARDLSIKTIYKFTQGFPIHWRYVTQCSTCHGTGKDGNNTCPDCDGLGYYRSKDVTDMVTLPIPTDDQPVLAPNIAGHVTPDIETWTKYDNELELLEKLCHKTLWGSYMIEGGNETATGRWIDIQPVMNKLNRYSEWAEHCEFKFSEWFYKYLNPNSSDQVSSIQYGRRYIIESQDVILEKYQKARLDGANSMILDRLMNEYITSKFKGDAKLLREELVKYELEPYKHLSIEETSKIFGLQEANRKNVFSNWWLSLSEDDKLKDLDVLKLDFSNFFEQNNVFLEDKTNQNE